jgi:hypothetical protein
MRVTNKANCFYIEGINTEGYFWVNLDTLKVDEEKTARLLGCIDNTMTTIDADLALWYWKLAHFTNNDF